MPWNSVSSAESNRPSGSPPHHLARDSSWCRSMPPATGLGRAEPPQAITASAADHPVPGGFGCADAASRTLCTAVRSAAAARAPSTCVIAPRTFRRLHLACGEDRLLRVGEHRGVPPCLRALPWADVPLCLEPVFGDARLACLTRFAGQGEARGIGLGVLVELCVPQE